MLALAVGVRTGILETQLSWRAEWRDAFIVSFGSRFDLEAFEVPGKSAPNELKYKRNQHFNITCYC